MVVPICLIMYKYIAVILLLTGILQLTIAKPQLPLAETPNGKVEGFFRKTNDGQTFMQFNGIPYAKPPLGKHRFALPQPAEKWPGTWIANSTTMCIQIDHYDTPQDGLTTGTEDCLYVNVFVPGDKIDPSKNYDVIVHIHGGGFMFGSAFGYSHPKTFMNRDVVFVTFNYRLGIFGFLSTEDKYLPGNLGMKDQNMALKWVQKHIKSFGGNPDSVTITGLSAGGASVHYHLLSPMSKGLFHKAISMSGNALDPWTMHEAPLAKAKKVGKLVGCHYENSKDFLNCLRRRPAQQIVETTKAFRTWAYLPFSPFALVVDNKAAEPFLPEHPYKLLSEGKISDVPWIASLTTSEGLYPVAQLAARPEYFDQLRDNWEEYIALTLHYDLTAPKNKMTEIATKIKKQYLGDREVSKETYPEIIQLASDRLFVVGMEKAVRMHAKAIKSPVYFYQYNYTSEETCSFAEVLFHYKEKYGVSHGDDTMLIFDQGMKGSATDEKMSDFLIDIWVSMAKTGKPGVKDWETLNKNPEKSLNYLYIGSPEDIEMRSSNDLGHKDFWNSLPFAENERLAKKNYKSEL